MIRTSGAAVAAGLILTGALGGTAFADDSGGNSGVKVTGHDQKDSLGRLLPGFTRSVVSVDCPDGGYLYYGGVIMTGLPDGLYQYGDSRTDRTLVSGTPTKAGTYKVHLDITCMGGTGPERKGSGDFTWVIEEKEGDSGITLNAFNQHHKVGAWVGNLNPVVGSCRKNSPDHTPKFTLTGLPPGIEANEKGGVWGQPSKAGTYTVKVNAVCNEDDQAFASFVWKIDDEAQVPMSGGSVALIAAGAAGVALAGGAHLRRRKKAGAATAAA
ncbi:hypothetical protein ACH429_09900 [Streptomyces pathocidini]|uniref:Uncharacterized protein n=1 Tax=Streptomyces pathocidini TaxID=1650571 RepID=A0ABW7USN2_9ACTN|nr:hypothetical protein [Streptomyces pathocidini]